LAGKGRRAVRLFFNTYYEDRAERIIEALKGLGFEMYVKRSKVVPELYYVDINVGDANLDEVKEEVENILRKEADDTVFGIKIYVIDANK
jgi:hypothetical protein